MDLTERQTDRQTGMDMKGNWGSDLPGRYVLGIPPYGELNLQPFWCWGDNVPTNSAPAPSYPGLSLSYNPSKSHWSSLRLLLSFLQMDSHLTLTAV